MSGRRFGVLTGVIWAVGVALSAAAEAASFAYVGNTFDGTVSVVDTATNVVVTTIPLGSGGPVDMVVSPSGSQVFVATIGPGTVTVIDTTANSVAYVIPLGANPRVIAIHPDGSRVFVTVTRANGDALLAIDTTTHAVVGDVPVAEDATAIAVDPLGARIFITDFVTGSVVVRDAATLASLPSLGVGQLPLAVAVHPSGSPLYQGHQDATAVLDPVTGAVLGDVPLCCTFSLVLNATGTRLYAGTGAIVVVDTASNQVITVVDLPAPAADVVFDLAVHPNGSRVYAAGSEFDSDAPASVWVVDAVANAYLTAVTVGVGANAVAVGPESTCGNAVVEATEQCDDGNGVGGDGCEPTCTRTGGTQTTTTVSGSSTTTSSTTSTTVPVDCSAVPVGPTFASLNCRLAALVAAVQAEPRLEKLQPRLEKAARKAKERKEAAEAACADGDAKASRKQLKKVVRKLIQFSHRLRTNSARKKVDEAVREPLAQRADEIQDDAHELMGGLACGGG